MSSQGALWTTKDLRRRTVWSVVAGFYMDGQGSKTSHSLICCSKLTTLLVNVSLKLWSINMTYTPICLLKNVRSFCICKSYSHLFTKNTCGLDIVLIRRVNILTTHELVKLTTLWTTGPWFALCWELRGYLRIYGFCHSYRFVHGALWIV